MTDRDWILDRLPEPSGALETQTFPAPRNTAEDLWIQFDAALTALGGSIGDPKILEDLFGSIWVDEELRGLIPGHSVDEIWQAEVGITRGDLAVAETGSILVSAGPGKIRLSSLCPPKHIVVINPGWIVANLEEAFAKLSTRTSVWITGPSRTADIEGVLVRGVHGPRELIVVRSDRFE